MLEEKLNMYFIKKKNLKTKIITNHNCYYQYAKNTFDKYLSKNNDSEVQMELAAQKFIAKNKLL